jgi:general secretion pathway protein G
MEQRACCLSPGIAFSHWRDFMRRQVNQHTNRKAFSLIELVIVVVIIAIIGAIAIPRMSRGAAGAADSALAGNLSILRSAIDIYATEHGGSYPTVANFVNQLTRYSNDAGDSFSDTKSATHPYGPYLRKIPPLPVGTYKGQSGIAAPGAVPPAAENSSGTVGWLYDAATGQIWANSNSYFSQ